MVAAMNKKKLTRGIFSRSDGADGKTNKFLRMDGLIAVVWVIVVGHN